jgi:hypothetical protein
MRQIRGFVVLLVGLVLSAGGAARSGEPTPLALGEGRLSVTQELTPGLSYCTVEFVRGDTLVRTKVAHAYNPPTGEGEHQGDLLPVYLVITGQAPKESVPVFSAGDLIKALKDQGYEVSAVKETRADGGKAAKGGGVPGPRVETYTVRPGPKRPSAPGSAPDVPK